MRPTRCALAVCAVLLWARSARPDGPYAPDVPEPGSVEEIARFTTDPRFVSPWVAYVPDSASIPSPSKYLGHVAGAAGELSGTAKIYGYLRALAAASPRVRVETLGKSEEGREILLVAIADEDGIRDLGRLRAATAALADPRGTSPQQAETVIAGARPIYYLNAGLHSDESGSSEMVMELAYRLAVSEQLMIREIRRRLVVLINPAANPDGRDKMAEWFAKYLKGRTDYDRLPRQSPPYWGKYAYVDVNRDAHQLDFEATRAVQKMFFAYHPTVIHDLHEAIALLQTWNGTGPYDPHLDPIVTSEFLEMSFHEVTTLTALGMPGVWTWKFGEGFGHHYLESVAMNHNSVGRGYETFGNATAETVERALDADETTREWYRPLPAPPHVRWSMRDNTNYMETAALSILDYAAKQGPELLRNFYRTGYNSWQAGLSGPPYAFAIPEVQPDRRRVAQLVDLLLRQGIEVGRTRAALRVREGEFPAGTFVVRLDQPYRNYAVDLLTPQHFPEDAPEPYDDISWALPLHYGVGVTPIADESVKAVALDAVREAGATGQVSGAGPVFLLKDTGQEALLAARFRLSGTGVEIAEKPFRAGRQEYPAGSWILAAQPGLGAKLSAVASELALDFESAPAVPDVTRHDAPVPRVGVWVPWADTDSIGWIRYILDQRGIPYTYLRDEDVRAGALRGRVDVIVYGHVDLDLQGQIHGIAPVAGPMPFRSSRETPSLGTPVASDDITGGIGWTGLAKLQEFVEGGGLLVTLGSGSTLALDGGLVRNVRRTSLPSATPGTHVRATFARPDHPLAYGYPRFTTVFRGSFPLYDMPRRWLRMAYCTSCLDGPEDPSGVVLAWGEPGAPLVVSGGARGGEKLEGRPAILDLPAGKGRVVAFNFNPLHRDLNRADHRLVWNAILNWRALLSR